MKQWRLSLLSRCWEARWAPLKVNIISINKCRNKIALDWLIDSWWTSTWWLGKSTVDRWRTVHGHVVHNPILVSLIEQKYGQPREIKVQSAIDSPFSGPAEARGQGEGGDATDRWRDDWSRTSNYRLVEDNSWPVDGIYSRLWNCAWTAESSLGRTIMLDWLKREWLYQSQSNRRRKKTSIDLEINRLTTTKDGITLHRRP